MGSRNRSLFGCLRAEGLPLEAEFAPLSESLSEALPPCRQVAAGAGGSQGSGSEHGTPVKLAAKLLLSPFDSAAWQPLTELLQVHCKVALDGTALPGSGKEHQVLGTPGLLSRVDASSAGSTQRPELMMVMAGGSNSFSVMSPPSWADVRADSLGGSSLLSVDDGVSVGRTSDGGHSSSRVQVKLQDLHQLLGAVSRPLWVGQGAGGAVLKAQWRSGCTVAVKWVVTSAVDVPSAYMEALVAKMLAHPYLVQTFDYAMCQLDGCSLGAEQQAICGDENGVIRSWYVGLRAVVQRQQQAEQEQKLCGQAAAAHSDNALSCETNNCSGGWSGGAQHPLLAHEAGAAAEADAATAAYAVDSFDCGYGVQQPPRPIDSIDLLLELGAAPGKFVVQIVSEWCDEGTLHAAIRRGVFTSQPSRSAAWAMRSLLRTAREVALGMCHLHSLNIIHGDLKPGNVLLKSSRIDARGFVAKVADFGLSRLCGAAQEFVPTSEWSTVPYMAGEYLDNRLCRSSDVYSFGVLLWQMYTGKTPFAGYHEAHVAVGVMTGNLQLEWPADMPPPLLRLGQACCRHEPERRPTFNELVVALADIEAQVADAHRRAELSARRLHSSTAALDIGQHPLHPLHGTHSEHDHYSCQRDQHW